MSNELTHNDTIIVVTVLMLFGVLHVYLSCTRAWDYLSVAISIAVISFCFTSAGYFISML